MKSAERMSQTDVVVERLKEFFLSDTIQEGEKLPTDKQLCETLHVGRSTIREAVRVLQVMGFVKLLPGRGAFLERKRLDDPTAPIIQWISDHKPHIRDIVETRMLLEVRAARLAVERHNAEDMSLIESRCKAFEAALDNKEYDKLAALDGDFHKSIVAATHDELLVILNNIVMLAFSEYRAHSFQIKTHAANAIIPHREIMTAIREKDVKLAEFQVQRHLERVLKDMDSASKGDDS
jgi:GntR family transcriptional regulator, transcriptional repressor for pyruvate dehydrogenase complex